MTAKEEFYQTINDILPNMWEWLIISKDYAFELFGRYHSFLIIQDAIVSFIAFIALIVFLVLFIRTLKNREYIIDYNDEGVFYFLLSIALFFLFVAILFFSTSILELIKTIYIPEIKIVELFRK